MKRVQEFSSSSDAGGNRIVSFPVFLLNDCFFWQLTGRANGETDEGVLSQSWKTVWNAQILF